jgi:diaminopimelate decarboxylase
MDADMGTDVLNGFSPLTAGAAAQIAEAHSTPAYIYDEALIIEKCRAVLSMPNAYGLTVRYAMKANSNRTLLRLIAGQGLHIDASSLAEARRARMAGIPCGKVLLTTQEPLAREDEARELRRMMLDGLKYNVCSLRQLSLSGDFAAERGMELSIRIHPGAGAGESASRNTGDHYSCFGVHRNDIPKALALAGEKGLKFAQVHVHIGSGGDPEKWRQNIDAELGFVEECFPDATSVSFGGGLKEARMPSEAAADIAQLGGYAKARVEAFYRRTGRKLKIEIEPGTFIMANAGYAITTVLDKKDTGEAGFRFIVVDGGMEINARPLMYGSQHPFYVVSKDGRLLYSDFFVGAAGGRACGGDGSGASGRSGESDGGEAGSGEGGGNGNGAGERACGGKGDGNGNGSGAHGGAGAYSAVIVGRCCESGDSQCLDSQGLSYGRRLAEPEFGDYVLIGGVGAYCSAMAPFNYNSHAQIPEILLRRDGRQELIRKRQTLEQIVENEA